MRGSRFVTTIITGLAATGLVLAGCTSPSTDAAEAAQPSFLWVVTAEGGFINGIGEDTGNEVLTMTLVNVRDHATQFTDRPFRDAYVISIADFTERWTSWFADGDAPNAVLSFNLPDDPMPHAIVLELTEPPIQDPAANTLTFITRHIHRTADLHADAIEAIAPPRTFAPEHFLAATLFIDSATDEAETEATAEQTRDATDAAVTPEPIEQEATADPTDAASAAPTPTSALKATNGPAINDCVIAPRTECPKADLAGADLTGVDLSEANLEGADLTGANLMNADLRGANFNGATLTDAVITGAILDGAQFADAKALSFDPLDPRFAKAWLCQTRMGKGVVNSKDCACTSGAGINGTEPLLATMSLGLFSSTLKGTMPARGQAVPIQQNTALFSLIGLNFGGDGRKTFAAPNPTGPWAGVRTGTGGDGGCLGWSVAVQGIFPWEALYGVLPGQVFITAVSPGHSTFHSNVINAGATRLDDIGAYLGPGFTAYQIPASYRGFDDIVPTMGEMRLFSNAMPLPEPFVPADGRATVVRQQPVFEEGLIEIYGDKLPVVVAPDGYVWAVATHGVYPQFS